MSAQIQSRADKLRSLLNADNEAVLLTDEINVGYFSGFLYSEGAMLITKEKSLLFVDFRYFEAAQKYSSSCEVVLFKQFNRDISEYLKKYMIKNLYIEISDVCIKAFNSLKAEFSSIGFECVTTSLLDDKISEIRSVKDKSECEKILKAQQIAEAAYLEVLNYLKPGVSERKIAVELEYLMKLKGAESVSFDLITITGKKTSLPHGVPSDDIVSEGDFFTMDFGAVFDGYHSDTTRTVAVKSASDEQRRIYDTVLKAQLSALNVIKEGVKCSEVDKAARNIIANDGYGDYFGHSTGHGVGLEIHEAPNVSPKNDLTLKSGMIITDEPGIYLPDKFGVRIEDMLCVTENGCINFVTLPKELIIV
ncbi:MAG: aminopeptidase P family protein [Clostridiales bacterium]|nr:aminopeptidase P family protein [Clostridiales bacterium]